MAGRRAPSEKFKLAKQTDVAERAGVSTATVSYVLNGQVDRVSEQTRKKVLDAMRELGYKAPPADRRTTEPYTHTIGVLAPDLTESPILRDFYFREVLDSILSTCLLHGWGVTVMAERMWADSGQTIRTGYDGKCDGILVITPQDDELVGPFSERGVPVVQIGTESRRPTVGSVGVDEREIGRRAAEIFLTHGHRRLAFAGKTGMESSRLRCEGFTERAEQGGANVFPADFSSFVPKEEMPHALDRWLLKGCTAVFAWTDDVACVLYKELAGRGLRVPNDISAIGVNDGRASILRPGLTSFALPLTKVGTRAAEMLLAQILKGQPSGERELFPATLVSRKSVQTAGTTLAKADLQ